MTGKSHYGEGTVFSSAEDTSTIPAMDRVSNRKDLKKNLETPGKIMPLWRASNGYRMVYSYPPAVIRDCMNCGSDCSDQRVLRFSNNVCAIPLHFSTL